MQHPYAGALPAASCVFFSGGLLRIARQITSTQKPIQTEDSTLPIRPRRRSQNANMTGQRASHKPILPTALIAAVVYRADGPAAMTRVM